MISAFFFVVEALDEVLVNKVFIFHVCFEKFSAIESKA